LIRPHVLRTYQQSTRKIAVQHKRQFVCLIQRNAILTWHARISGDVSLLSVEPLEAIAPKRWSNSISRSKSFLLSAFSPWDGEQLRLAALDVVGWRPKDKASLITPSYTVVFSLDPVSASRNSRTPSLTFSGATMSRAANGTIRPWTEFAYATSAISFVFSLRSLTAVKSWRGTSK
jgi:hypothetical protein